MKEFFKLTAERLEQRAKSLAQVTTAIDAGAVLEQMATGADVSAIVHPLSDTAAPVAEGSLKVRQLETWLFGVTLVLTFPGGFEQFETARDEAKEALAGWLPDGMSKAVEYVGGATLSYSASLGGRWIWLQRYRCTFKNSYEVTP
jgi:hypothetical protein